MKGFNFARGALQGAQGVLRASAQQSRRRVFNQVRNAKIGTQAHAPPKTIKPMGPFTIIFAATFGSALVTAAVYPDDATHAYQASARSGRVVGALAKCINE